MHAAGATTPTQTERASASRDARMRVGVRAMGQTIAPKMPWSREQIAERAARELPDGAVVNLGIGIPTLIPNYLRHEQGILVHSENGLLGMGPFPYEDEVDAQIVNAGKQTVTIVAGGSTFDSALSFAMIRGGHVDVAVLGAMEVSCRGDLANWMVPGKKVAGIGGAMDLATGAKRVIAVLNHRDRDSRSKLVTTCSLPLTAPACVDLVITDLAVIAVEADCFRLVEIAPGVGADEVRRATEGPLRG
jgi:3-oxoacid CoA-transferase subunit B